ncbi:MAG TPA: R3H domain-containing nucleic acid-binding protein, partial [Limnochordales bacterium]
QLVATAHGNTLENLVLNPTLSDLIGGIQAVTLGDEEARKRGTQKTVLERKAPPTFPVVIEIQDRDRLAVHHDVATTVDRWLRGFDPQPEIRQRTVDGAIDIRPAPAPEAPAPQPAAPQAAPPNGARTRQPASGFIRIYPYAVSRNRLERAIAETGAPVRVTDDPHQAHMVLTLKGQYRKMPKKLRELERNGVPIHVIRSNTLTQIQAFLLELVEGDEEETEAIIEAEAAIQKVRREMHPVELSPRRPYLRRLQHELVERAQLKSISVGEEPYRRVRILPVRLNGDGEPLDDDR